MQLVDNMLAGDQQALSRLITLVERDDPEVPQLMKEVYPHTGKGYCIGVTGPPGAGKSTVVDKLTAVARGKGLSVGIIAVDPTSPFTGGAVLGDRIRMQQHYLDDSVFIRSMATRGSHGGLPRTAKSVMRLLDAFGRDLVMVETVGVGQTELDVVEGVDTTVVVLVPEAGDTIQVMKAGLMEIADIFVVNKADREGANRMIIELRTALLTNCREDGDWQMPIMPTEAVNNVGIEELYAEIERHREHLEASGGLAHRRQEQRKKELLLTIGQRLTARCLALIEKDEELIDLSEKVKQGELDPYSAAEQILGHETILKNLLCDLQGGSNPR